MRIQLHGQFVIEGDGPGADIRLPGRRARLLVAYLAAHGSEAVERSRLIEALWSPSRPSDNAGRLFDPLLSKTRAAIAPAEIRGRAGLRLVLPSESLVDADRAAEALHDAEAAASRGRWRRAWAQALSAMFVTQRPFLPEVTAPWAERCRTEAQAAHVRATSCYAEACLELGGAELASAERCARRLVAADPLAERSALLLMRAVNARGDRAAALVVFAQLHRTLRDQLGVSPGPQVSALHQALLGDPSPQTGRVRGRGQWESPAAVPDVSAHPEGPQNWKVRTGRFR